MNTKGDTAVSHARSGNLDVFGLSLERAQLNGARQSFVYKKAQISTSALVGRGPAVPIPALLSGGRTDPPSPKSLRRDDTPGWLLGADGRKTWPVDNYLCEGPRRTDWLAKGVIKQHRTLATYLNLLLRLGFALSHVEEWGPTDEQIAAQPVLEAERHRPMFLLVAARR